MVWCPRCQYPALLQEEGGRLALCGRCQFGFCAECQQTWHGLAPCANLATRWRAADEAGKEVLRRKYGDKILQEVESSAWVREHTKPCPRCATPVEKNGGCNHITCRKCSHEWCWLCTSTYTQAHAMPAPSRCHAYTMRPHVTVYTVCVICAQGHFKNGACDQFSQDFFDEINLTREEFDANYVVNNHW